MPLDLEKKLATARTKLILEKPFLGALVLRLPMVRAKDDWCDATFSNGKTVCIHTALVINGRMHLVSEK